jgi:DNA mismatch repair protein MutL
MTDAAPAIHVLGEETINQIAAGEVVERPASVVKELVENAIDAGAVQVRIEIGTGTGGITSIRVVDDGSGMHHGDALLAFRRHATSKISEASDLARVRTMGFRGEALASIAAVARVGLVTKHRDDPDGPATKIRVEGGEIIDVSETGAPVGTTVAVTDLFFNTPARRKFLRAARTELAHIYRMIEQIALAHRNVGLRVFADGRERMATRPTDSLEDTIAAIYGIELAGSLIAVSGRTAFMRIGGCIAPPSVTRPNLQQVQISINNRQVASTALARAVREGYGTLLPKNRSPVAFLDLEIDTALVDVNVHPAKREVRLSREREITQEVAHCIAAALQKKDLLPDAALRGSGDGRAPPAGIGSPAAVYQADRRQRTLTQTRLRSSQRQDTAAQEAAALLPEMEVLGQVAASYIVARTEDDEKTLLIIDQHAAHERVLYEQTAARRDRENESQELIVPVVLELTAREAEAVSGALHVLMQQGFVLEPFGPAAFAVRTVPVVLGKNPDPALLTGIISDIAAAGASPGAEFRERVTALIACKGAIKAGDALTREQMERLITQLRATAIPWTCPHGRPTIIAIPRTKLDVLFNRT